MNAIPTATTTLTKQLSLDDNQEQARALHRKQAEMHESVIVRSPHLLVTPIIQCGPTHSILIPKWNQRDQDRPSHLIWHRYTQLEVYAIDWEFDSDLHPDSSDSPFTLRLNREPIPPVMGCILQTALLPQVFGHQQKRDFLLVTSSSGFLSLLTFDGRLQPVAHVRIGTGSRGGLGVGRRNMGAYLRVSESGHAIAVASLECVTKHKRPKLLSSPTSTSAEPSSTMETTSSTASVASTDVDEDVDIPAEGGILVFPCPPSKELNPSASSLPDLSPPINIQLHGNITALIFLPTNSLTQARLLVAFVPHPSNMSVATESMRLSGEHVKPPIYPVKPTQRTSSATPQLLLFVVDLLDGSFQKHECPMKFQPNDSIQDMILVNPPRPTSGSIPSSSKSPCFILLQLHDRVTLFDLDCESTLLFPISIPLPRFISDDSTNDKSIPNMTSWCWIGQLNEPRRLVGVNEAGDVHYLHFWWNTPGATIPSNDTVTSWMRFVSLGLANPSDCIAAISSPAKSAGTVSDMDESMSSQTSSSSRSVTSTDFLLMPGQQSDGMIARIDWSVVDQKLEEQTQLEAQSRSSSLAAIDPSAHTSLVPMESALHRQSQTITNLSDLHDFLSINVTTHPSVKDTISPSKHDQLFLLSGSGSHGSLRIMRSNTIQAEITASMPADQKVFHGLISLTLIDPQTRTRQTCGLISSFFGSTRLSAIRGGELEDISEDLAVVGLELNQTTLDAALTKDGRFLFQVDDRRVRAIRLSQVDSEQFKGQGSPIIWQTTDSTNGPQFTIAHIYDNFILLSRSSTHSIVLLQFQPNVNNGQFIQLAEVTIKSDVSCLHVAPIRTSGGSSISVNDLIFFIGTHDNQVHLLRAPTASNQPWAFFHSIALPTLVPSESPASIIAESIILASNLDRTVDSTPRFQLYVGIRDGSLLRLNFHPQSFQPNLLLQQPLVRRFGSAPVKLARLESNHDVYILAMTDQTYIIPSQLHLGVSDSRPQQFSARELCWPWNTHTSSSLQFATSFSVDGSSGVACVIAGSFFLIELDPTQDERESITTFPLGATPEFIQYDNESNLFCILTREKTNSQLLLVDPFTGKTLDRYSFGSDLAISTAQPSTTTAATAASSTTAAAASSVPIPADPPTIEIAQCMMIWEYTKLVNQRYLLVGTSTMTARRKPVAGLIHGFIIEAVKPTPITISSASSPSPMDCSMEDGTSQEVSSSSMDSATASSPSAYRLRHQLVLRDSRSAKSLTGVTSLAPIDGASFMYSLGSITCQGALSKEMRLTPLRALRHTPNTRMRDISVVHQKAHSLFAMTDQKFGVTLYRGIGFNRKECSFVPEQSDPYGRLALQGILYESPAELEYAVGLSTLNSDTPLPIKHIQLIPGSVATSSSPGSTSILRAMGIDAFGHVFLVRREPELTVSPNHPLNQQPTVTTTTSATSSATSKLLPENTVNSSLVQESSFLLPSQPSRIRQIKTAKLASLRSVDSVAESKQQESSHSSSSNHGQPALADGFLISTHLGGLYCIREVSTTDSLWLYALQTALATSPHTRSMVANHQPSYRGGNSSTTNELMLDGEQLAAFFLLTNEQQQEMCQRIVYLNDIPVWKINDFLGRLLFQWQDR